MSSETWHGVHHDGYDAGGYVYQTLKGLGWRDLAVTFALCVFSYAIMKSVYNVYFHPLSGFPGPKSAGMSNIFRSMLYLSGKSYITIRELHEKYGPVVRIAPNNLSFCTVTALKTIYGHPGSSTSTSTSTSTSKQHNLWIKGPYYDFEKDLAPGNLFTERDPRKHAIMRKIGGNAFSKRALDEQEDFVMNYVDLVVEQLRRRSWPSGPERNDKGEDMVKWFTWATFDVISDLAFGEPFGSLKAGKGHVWVEFIFENIMTASYVSETYYYPWINKLLKAALPMLLPKEIESRVRHQEFSRRLIERRMNAIKPRKDFMSYFLPHKDDQGWTDKHLAAQASVFVIAGSETTATFLSSTFYRLLRNPHAFRKLKQEIRTAFNSSTQITHDSTQKLPYLNAVIEEGLRIFTPAPFPQYRISPGAVVDGWYVPPGAEVHIEIYSITRSKEYFVDPDEFVPERWLPGNSTYSGEIKEASAPFSIGSRSCIGRNLAYMEMRLFLSKLIWEFDFEWPDGYGEKELEKTKLEWEEMKFFALWDKPELWVKCVEVKR